MTNACIMGLRGATLVLLLVSIPIAGCGGDDGGGGEPGPGTGGSPGSSTGGAPGGAGMPGGGGGPVATVSYSDDLSPIFSSKCDFCHTDVSAIKVDFTQPFSATLGIVNRPNTWVSEGSQQTLIVDPGNVANSFLITKVVETNLDPHVDGGAMPLHLPDLTEAELAAVEQWILDGAESAAYAATVAPIFGTAISLGAAAGKCTWCHFPGNKTRVDVTKLETMVNADSLYQASKIVLPGDPDASILMKKLTGAAGIGPKMPYHPERVTAAEVELMKTWIEEGAQNN